MTCRLCSYYGQINGSIGVRKGSGRVNDQHLRDLFDERGLLENEGIDDELRRASLVCVISHNRPKAEVLTPTLKPLAEEFARGFAGMTQEPVTPTNVETAREVIIAAMEDHRRFVVGFRRSETGLRASRDTGAQHLPAVVWKQRDLAKLPDVKRRELADALGRVLFP